jgi:hypothetical protein
MVQRIQSEPVNPEFAAALSGADVLDDAADQIRTGEKPKVAELTEVFDPITAWAEIPQMVGSILCLAMPELKDVYNEKACRAWGESMHRLATKRGWSADGLPPEVTVAMTSAMFVIPTGLCIKQRRDQAQRAREAQQNAAAAAGEGNGDAPAT